MPTITMLRHGRTVANAGGLLQGRSDNPLDDFGHRQAIAAARALGPVDLVIASPLRRAQETAEHLAADHRTDDRFVELDYGEWDLKPLADVPPEVWRRWRGDLNLRPPGGETLNELGGRVRAALDDLVSAGPPDHTVIVSHVSPIKAAVAWALGVDDHISWRMRLTTGSYSQLSVAGQTRSLVSFNVLPNVDA